MAVTIPIWAIPLAITVVIWIVTAILCATTDDSGYLGNGPLIFFYGVVAVILTLIVWLVYFIIV